MERSLRQKRWSPREVYITRSVSIASSARPQLTISTALRVPMMKSTARYWPIRAQYYTSHKSVDPSEHSPTRHESIDQWEISVHLILTNQNTLCIHSFNWLLRTLYSWYHIAEFVVGPWQWSSEALWLWQRQASCERGTQRLLHLL